MRRPVDDLRPLLGLRFTGGVWAMPEGRIALANEPLLEVTAALAAAQLVETWLPNQITFSTALASKAARCVLATPGTPVVDFSLRRTQGAEAGMQAARIARTHCLADRRPGGLAGGRSGDCRCGRYERRAGLCAAG
jgi:nicotinate phosphoribosyltransferase